MTSRVQFAFPTLTQDVPGAASRRWPGSHALDLMRAVAERWRERRMLAEMDDRMLRDIGISRSQALAEARKPFWQR